MVGSQRQDDEDIGLWQFLAIQIMKNLFTWTFFHDNDPNIWFLVHNWLLAFLHTPNNRKFGWKRLYAPFPSGSNHSWTKEIKISLDFHGKCINILQQYPSSLKAGQSQSFWPPSKLSWNIREGIRRNEDFQICLVIHVQLQQKTILVCYHEMQFLYQRRFS